MPSSAKRGCYQRFWYQSAEPCPLQLDEIIPELLGWDPVPQDGRFEKSQGLFQQISGFHIGIACIHTTLKETMTRPARKRSGA